MSQGLSWPRFASYHKRVPLRLPVGLGALAALGIELRFNTNKKPLGTSRGHLLLRIPYDHTRTNGSRARSCHVCTQTPTFLSPRVFFKLRRLTPKVQSTCQNNYTEVSATRKKLKLTSFRLHIHIVAIRQRQGLQVQLNSPPSAYFEFWVFKMSNSWRRHERRA